MDKFICTKCKFSLTIRKSTDSGKVTKISTGDELVSAFSSDRTQTYDLSLSDAELKKYQKKSINNPDLKIFYDELLQKNFVSKFILKCTSCGEVYHLQPETVIYSLNFNKQQSSFNDDNIDLKLYDPTLPRTKDYICPNNDCETNKKNFNTSNKEAVFYRANRSYHLKYACLNCKKSWAI